MRSSEPNACKLSARSCIHLGSMNTASTDEGIAARRHSSESPSGCDSGTKDPAMQKLELTDIFGEYGAFQRVVFIFAVTISMFGAYHNLIVTIVAPNVDHWCARTEGHDNLTVDEWKENYLPRVTVDGITTHSQCQYYANSTNGTLEAIQCNRWEYDTSFYRRTIVQEWDLVCSNKWYVSLSQSTYMAGYMTSMIIFGQLSDRIGRKTVIGIAFCVLLLSGFSTLVASSFVAFVSLRFFVSFGVSGVGSTAFVLLMEVIGPRLRSLFGLAYEFGWATGYLVLAMVAYFIRDWFYIQLVAMIGALVLLIGFRTLPESPRWLMANKQFDKAWKVIDYAIERNEVDREEARRKFDLLREECEKDEPRKLLGRANLQHLLGHRRLRRRTLIVFACWFVNSFTYYAMSLNTNDLGGNPFINFAIAGAVEFPAYAISIFIINKLGRRPSQSGCMILAGVACALTIPFSGDTLWLKITFAMIGKFLITASYGILYVYSAEIYPTVVRQIGMGSSSTIARFGAMIAPFVRELGSATDKRVPFAVYSAICILSGLSVILLPETTGVQLPDTIAEGEAFPAKEKKTKQEASNVTGV